MATLYIVSTPIGNLEDITLRALRMLREVALIAAEDTRHTRHLLRHYDITTPCISYHEHNKLTRLERVLEALNTGDVALVSDAGTPLLSDPGVELVRACIGAGVMVVPVPGASAPLAALVAAGFATERFLVVGFLPRRSSKRRAALASLAPLPATLVCFEAPHRLLETLTDMHAVLGNRRIAIARELTKLHEEVLRLDISGALAHFGAQRPRGEFTLVIEGHPADAADATDAPDAPAEGATPALDEAAIIARMHSLQEQGQRSSEAARTVAREQNLPKRTVYQLWLRVQEEQKHDTL
jgi:16S rRNA (cytidine1402-2'-O)-methyltransferase